MRGAKLPTDERDDSTRRLRFLEGRDAFKRGLQRLADWRAASCRRLNDQVPSPFFVRRLVPDTTRVYKIKAVDSNCRLGDVGILISECRDS